MHIAALPRRADLDALRDPELVERWTPAASTCASGSTRRSSRCGRTSRSAARSQASGRRSAPSGDVAGAARRARSRPADAVHRLAASSCASRSSGEPTRSQRRRSTRRRRQVRALLALRPTDDVSTDADAARALCGRCVDAVRASRERPREPMRWRVSARLDAATRGCWLAAGIVAARSAHQGARRARIAAAARRASTVIPGLLDFTHVATPAPRSASSTPPTSRSSRSSSPCSRSSR